MSLLRRICRVIYNARVGVLVFSQKMIDVRTHALSKICRGRLAKDAMRIVPHFCSNSFCSVTIVSFDVMAIGTI